MKPDKTYKKDSSIFDDVAKNDIPIPEEYLNLSRDELINGIKMNKIPIVYIFYKAARVLSVYQDEDFNFTLCWPGKEPEDYIYNKKWSDFIWNLNHIKKIAEKEGYPVKIVNSSKFLNKLYEIRKPKTIVKKKTCVWCGETTDTLVYNSNGKYNQRKVFCSDSDCKQKYKKFQRLLTKLVKDKKITEFEQDLRLNPAYSVIDDTWNNSYLMIHELLLVSYTAEELDELQEKEEIPLISDKKFFVTDDEKDVVYVLGKCPLCGRPYYGKSHSDFCSDKCRYEFHNMTNREYKNLPSDLIGIIADIPEKDFEQMQLKLKNVVSGLTSDIYKEYRKEEIRIKPESFSQYH